MEIEVRTITPDEAARLLADDVNVRNRRTDWKFVTTLARQMTAGEFKMVGDPIRISRTGALLDGQHRLEAVKQCKIPREFVVISGLADEDQAVMDIGKKRSPADVFHMYEVPNSVTAAAVVKLVMRYDMGNLMDNYTVQTGELLKWYQQEGNTELVNRGAAMGSQVKREIPLSPAVAGAIHVIASRISEPFAVGEFYEKLMDGANMNSSDPILAFRNWVLRRKRENLKARHGEFFFLMARTWNAWATEEEMYRVQLPRDGLTSSSQIPRLIPVVWQKPREVTEDNPAVTHYNKTRPEREAAARTDGRGRRRRAS